MAMKELTFCMLGKKFNRRHFEYLNFLPGTQALTLHLRIEITNLRLHRVMKNSLMSLKPEGLFLYTKLCIWFSLLDETSKL